MSMGPERSRYATGLHIPNKFDNHKSLINPKLIDWMDGILGPFCVFIFTITRNSQVIVNSKQDMNPLGSWFGKQNGMLSSMSSRKQPSSPVVINISNVITFSPW